MWEWLKRFVAKPKAFEEVLSPYQSAAQKLLRTSVDTGTVYRDTRKLEVLQDYVEDYTFKIQQGIYALHEDMVFPLQPLSLRFVKCCNFYRRINGEFINTEHAHRQFVKHAAEFLVLYELKEQQKGQSGKLQANLYRTKVIANNLVSLAEQLASL